MTVAEIQQYLSSVFDIELNIYIQEKTLQQIEKTYHTLGIQKNIQEPYRETADNEPFTIMSGVGFLFGIINGIIHAVIEYNQSASFIGGLFSAIIALIAYGVLGMLVGGFTLGLVASLIIKKSSQNRLDKQYQARLKKYHLLCQQDTERVNRELQKKQALKKEMQCLTNSLNRSKGNLAKLYSYSVLSADYQNIYAVSSIYHYFVSGRTQSLTFNASTGDQGAYNIYEYERRMDVIITNTEEILEKFDTVINQQYELANGLRYAQQTIRSLCCGITNHLQQTNRTLDEIKSCQQITAYAAERASRELEFITWMQLFG